MTQEQLEEILRTPTYPMDRRIADLNWHSAMRYGKHCADRSWRAGFFFGALITFIVALAGIWIAR